MKVKDSIAAALAITLAVCIAPSDGSAQQATSHSQQNFLSNVVRIGSSGYGLIVARGYNRLYVVTAKHVVADEKGNLYADMLPIFLQGDDVAWNERPVEDWRLPERPPLQDIIILGVFVPRTPGDTGRRHRTDPILWSLSLDEAPQVGDAVRLTATVNAIGYAPSLGIVEELSSEQGVAVRISGRIGQHGQSGAPIATEWGLIGIYLGNDGDDADFVALPLIRDAVISSFGQELWDLLPAPVRPVQTVLCVDLVGAPIDSVRLSGPEGLVILNGSACGRTLTGRHMAFGAPGSHLRCDPETFSVPAEVLAPFRITCKPDFGGIWHGPQSEFLTLDKVGDELWQFKLTHRPVNGEIHFDITGKARLRGDLMSIVSGKVGRQTGVTGSMRLSSGRLTLDLTTKSETLAMEFER